jgi:hypothetical protein
MGVRMIVSRVCETCGKEWPLERDGIGERCQCSCGGSIGVCEIIEPAEEEVIPLAVAMPIEAIDADTIPVIGGARRRVDPRTRTLNYRPSKLVRRDQKADSDLLLGSKWRDFYVPLCLILIGSLLYYGREIYLRRSFPEGILTASLQMMLNAFITVSVILSVRRLADMDLGSAAGTVLKLMSVAIFPNAVGGLAFVVGGDCAGVLLGLGGSLGLCLLLFMKLFDTNLGEGVLCVTLITIFNFVSWGWADYLFRLF